MDKNNMSETLPKVRTWRNTVVVLSLMLMLVAVPHTLEDFSLGEPAKNGVAVPVLATVVAVMFALQGLALFWAGQNKRLGYFIHMGLGAFWPLAAGSAQLPAFLTTTPYRSGFISILYVVSMMILGAMLFFASIRGLRAASRLEK
jgi:hypothetical protein